MSDDVQPQCWDETQTRKAFDSEGRMHYTYDCPTCGVEDAVNCSSPAEVREAAMAHDVECCWKARR